MTLVIKKSSKHFTGINDPLAAAAHEIENLPNAANASAKLRDLLKHDAINRYQVGGVLNLMIENSWFEPYKNFVEFCELGFGIKKSTAYDLALVYKVLVDMNVSCSEADSVGWAKLNLICNASRKHDWPAEKFFQTLENAKGTTFAALRQALKPPSPVQVNGTTHLTFKPHADQLDIITQALAKAKAESGNAVRHRRPRIHLPRFSRGPFNCFGSKGHKGDPGAMIDATQQASDLRALRLACKNRVETHFSPDASQELDRHLNSMIKQLRRLSRAVAQGNQPEACSIHRAILASYSARLVATIMALKPRHLRSETTFQDICDLARSVEPYKCDEPVDLIGLRKDDGGIRHVVRGGLKRCACQHLCLQILRAWASGSYIDYAQRGYGIERAADRIKALIENEGCEYFVIADIRDFFGSLNREEIIKALPLPRQVVEQSILVCGTVRVNVQSYEQSPLTGHDMRLVREAARRGLPQGLPASQYIASMLLGPTLAELPAWDRTVRYCDDIAVGARDLHEAKVIKDTLVTALSRSSVGPLRLKHCEIFAVSDGFDFTKYRYKRRMAWFGSSVHCCPSQRSYARFDSRFREKAEKRNGNRLAERYVDYWTKSFRRWTPNVFPRVQSGRGLRAWLVRGISVCRCLRPKQMGWP